MGSYKIITGEHMKNGMMVFEKEGFGKVRVIENDGGFWFVANDIAQALGYEKPNNAVNTHCKKVNKISYPETGQPLNVIPESDLYRLIMRSQLESAERFQDWVVEEVLPSIRKTGSYTIKKPAAQKTDQPIDMAPKTARAFRAYVSLMKTLGFDNNVAAISANQACLKLTGQNTLELLGQTHLDAEKQEQYFTPTELGKRINKNAREFNQLLLEKGLQEKVGDEWTPTDKGRNFCRMFDTGKKHGAGVSIVQVKWADSVVTALNKEKAA